MSSQWTEFDVRGEDSAVGKERFFGEPKFQP